MESMRIVERKFCEKENRPSVLLANIHVNADVQSNLKKMESIIQLAHEKGVNILIFPELCVTGYVWETEDGKEVVSHLLSGENAQIAPWINNVRDSLRTDGKGLEYIFFNNVRLKEGVFYNSTFILNAEIDYNEENLIYDKIFMPLIEEQYFRRGSDKRLTIDTKWGRFGFLTCYDLCFIELAREYALTDEVDAIVTMAHWRSEAVREYPQMNVRTDHYYGFIWNLMNSSKSAYNQVWTLGTNAVGAHDISGVHFWGGSGAWAPSGLQLIQASNIKEELIIIWNLDLKEQKEIEADEFNYRFDFHKVYQRLETTGQYTRYLP